MRTLAMCCLMILLVALAGCSGSGQENASDETAAQAAATHTETAPAAEATQSTVASSTPGEVMTLAGVTGCGHCNFHTTDGCAAAMKTADGTIYVIDGVDESTDLYTQRVDGKQVKVTGAVSDVDGVMHVAMQSYELE